MKRLVVVSLLLVLLLSGAVWSVGTSEGKELRILGGIDPTIWEYALKALQEKYPKATITQLVVDLTDGSTMTMDAMLAAGNAPNVYVDYMGRTSKYIDPAFALALDPPDRGDFIAGALEPLMRDGKLYGLPMPGGAQSMVINLKLLKQIGWGDFDFDNWTTKDFIRMADAMKAKAPDAWMTGLFAGNQSGDYLWFNWLATFGGRMYAGDYSKTAIDSPAGLQFFQWLQSLVKQGYAPAESAVLTDDDYALQWAQGKFLATAWYPAWVAPYFESVKKQGLGGADFDYKFVEFPRSAGVTSVPVAGSYAGVVVHRTADAALDAMAAEAAYILTDTAAQKILVGLKAGYPNRRSAATTFDDPHWQAIAQIVAENGMLDLGITTTKFNEIRALSIPQLQALYTGKKTASEAHRDYVKSVNEVLMR